MSSGPGPASSEGSAPKSLLGYEILGVLGNGAGSALYAAIHPETGQIYTLKHVVVSTEKDKRFIEQVETEYEVGRRVNHPHLRKSIDLKIERTLLRQPTAAILTMEFFDGVPLDRMVVASVPAIVGCALQTAQALQALHRLGYVHCDLKPINILLDAEERVKVIDLGQACLIGTKKERVQGTPDYIAPEQVRCEPVSVQTDVYNFGATFYWVLTGKNVPTLFTLDRGPNSFLVDAQVPTPAELRDDVPATLSSLIADCLHTSPSKRPADMAELIRRLEVIEFALARKNAPPPPMPESADMDEFI